MINSIVVLKYPGLDRLNKFYPDIIILSVKIGNVNGRSVQFVHLDSEVLSR
jgi:hypothetical protein